MFFRKGNIYLRLKVLFHFFVSFIITLLNFIFLSKFKVCFLKFVCKTFKFFLYSLFHVCFHLKRVKSILSCTLSIMFWLFQAKILKKLIRVGIKEKNLVLK